MFSVAENEVSARGVSGGQLTSSSKRSYQVPSWPSSYTRYYEPSHGQLGYTGGKGGWMPATNNVGSEFLEVRKTYSWNILIALRFIRPAPCKALLSLDSDNPQLHCFLGLGTLFFCSFFCSLDQPCKPLQTV